MRRKSLPIIIIILTGLVAAAGSFLINLASNLLPAEVTRHPLYSLGVWSLLGLMILAGIGLAVWQYRLGKAGEGPPAALERQNRRLMLDKVESTRINSVLGKPLPGSSPLVLELRERSDAVSNPSRQRFQRPDSPVSIPSTEITQVYHDAAGALLILGESGSGKTTLLLQLARELIAQARQDETLPMPVLFNLTSWALKRQSLADWLIEELRESYHIAPVLAQFWIENDQVLPLLDGLDRVPSQHLETCVKTINAYRREHGLLPLVICSRRDEYLKLERRLLLQKAIVIEPLSTQVIDDYLSKRGTPLAKLRTTIDTDPELQKLVATPLMLSILPLAYRAGPDEDLAAASHTAWQDQVLAHFVQRMLQDPATPVRYTARQTMRWLTWLAWQMKRHSQTEFYLERMQPDWLRDDSARGIYHGIVYLLIGALCGALIFGMLSSYQFGPLVALKAGLAWILYTPVFLAFFRRPETDGQPLPRTFSLLMRRLYHKFARKSVLILVLLFIAIGTWKAGIAVGLYAGFFNTLIVGLLSTLLDAIDPSIHPVEFLAWSWREIAQSLQQSLPLGCSFGLLVMLDIAVALTPRHGLSVGLSTAFGGGLVVALLGGLVATIVGGLAGGIPSGKLDERTFLVPNQGIRRSARNSLLAGSLSGLFIGIVSAFVIALVVWPSVGLLPGLPFAAIAGALLGVLGGFTVALERGGIAWIQHYILRLILWDTKRAPLRYPRFLHYAAGCNLLYRTGGAYIFFHPSLQDYLAAQVNTYFSHLENEPITGAPTSSSQGRPTASPRTSKGRGMPGQRKLTGHKGHRPKK